MLSKNLIKVFNFYFYEHYERKIGYIFLFTSFVFLILIMSLRVFERDMPNKVIIDFSFSGIALINLILSFSLSLTSVPSDIKNRYIYTMLAKPVSRYDYLAGKFLSICAVVFINVLIMIAELLVVTYSKPGFFEPNIIWAGFFYFPFQCDSYSPYNIFLSFSSCYRKYMSEFYYDCSRKHDTCLSDLSR